MSQEKTSSLAARLRNLLIVFVAFTLAAAIFFGVKTETASSSLTQMAEASMPLEAALSNGKPTFMEFYANWCASCQAMAPDLIEMKQQYADQLNFVMLNVDNSKWLPELAKYRVDGIPHFVFLNPQGEAIAQTIGEVPRAILAANLEALIAGNPLPYAEASGQVSQFNSPASSLKASQTDPRSHGSQVQ